MVRMTCRAVRVRPGVATMNPASSARSSRNGSDRARLALIEAETQRKIDRDVSDRTNVLAEEANAASERRHQESMTLAREKEARAVEDGKRADIRLKRISGTLKGILFTMPINAQDLPMYFEAIERIFNEYITINAHRKQMSRLLFSR